MPLIHNRQHCMVGGLLLDIYYLLSQNRASSLSGKRVWQAGRGGGEKVFAGRGELLGLHEVGNPQQ